MMLHLSGCYQLANHSGMVNEGRRVLSSATSTFKLAPKTEHYGRMVDMLCRAGLLDEAFNLIESTPIERLPKESI